MPRQGLTRAVKPAPHVPAHPAHPAHVPAPVSSVQSPSIIGAVTHGVASGMGTGIGFSLAQSFMQQFRVEKDPQVCQQYDANLQKCMFENDMETCHKIFKNLDTNFYTKCVPTTNQLSKE